MLGWLFRLRGTRLRNGGLCELDLLPGTARLKGGEADREEHSEGPEQGQGLCGGGVDPDASGGGCFL